MHTIGFHSAIKKNKIVQLAWKQLELEVIILNEISQNQNDKYHIFSHADSRLYVYIHTLTCRSWKNQGGYSGNRRELVGIGRRGWEMRMYRWVSVVKVHDVYKNVFAMPITMYDECTTIKIILLKIFLILFSIILNHFN